MFCYGKIMIAVDVHRIQKKLIEKRLVPFMIFHALVMESRSMLMLDQQNLQASFCPKRYPNRKFTRLDSSSTHELSLSLEKKWNDAFPDAARTECFKDVWHSLSIFGKILSEIFFPILSYFGLRLKQFTEIKNQK